MPKKNLPDLDYHTIETLADEWGCQVSRVEQYIKSGKLKAHIISKAWRIDLCYIEKDENTWHAIPDKTITTKRGDFLEISKRSAEDLIAEGESDNIIFEGFNSDYVTFSPDYYDEILIRKADIVIRNESIFEFSSKIPEASERKNKQVRESELINCIGLSFKKVKSSSKGKPSADSVWKQLIIDDHDCIHEIAFCKTSNEEAIFWKSKRVDQKLLYSSFKNIVSDYNTGKKTLP